jgi:hypothetical protein
LLTRLPPQLLSQIRCGSISIIYVACPRIEPSDYVGIISCISVRSTAAVIDGFDRFLKFLRGLRLPLEKTVLFVASDDVRRYGFGISAPDAEIIFNVEGAGRIFGVWFPSRHG